MKIDFEFSTPFGTFRDALFLPPDHPHSEEEVEEMKQERLQKWLDFITNQDYGDPPPHVSITETGNINVVNITPLQSSPKSAIEQLLEVAELNSNDKLYDLGCGEGEVLITAAKLYGVTGVGCDIEQEMIDKSITNANEAGVSDLVTFTKSDIIGINFIDATAVYLYLSQEMNDMLEDLLFSLRPGTKIISFQYTFKNHSPKQVIFTSAGKGYIWKVGE
jgi:SAM-dependent methyltransferase